MAPGQMATWNADPSAVPVPVKIACALTWVFSGLVALTYAGVLVALIAVQDQIVEYVVDSPEWKRANLPQDLLVPALWLAVLLFLAWAVGACVLAWFTWRRHNWARWLLATSAAGAFVVGMLAFPAGHPAPAGGRPHDRGAVPLHLARLVRAGHPEHLAGPTLGPTDGPPPGHLPGHPLTRPTGSRRAASRPDPLRTTRPEASHPSGDQWWLRSVSRNRLSPSTIRSCCLQNAHRIRWRPCSEPSS